MNDFEAACCFLAFAFKFNHHAVSCYIKVTKKKKTMLATTLSCIMGRQFRILVMFFYYQFSNFLEREWKEKGVKFCQKKGRTELKIRRYCGKRKWLSPFFFLMRKHPHQILLIFLCSCKSSFVSCSLVIGKGWYIYSLTHEIALYPVIIACKRGLPPSAVVTLKY